MILPRSFGKGILIIGDKAINWHVKIRFQYGSIELAIKILEMMNRAVTKIPIAESVRENTFIQDQSYLFYEIVKFREKN